MTDQENKQNPQDLQAQNGQNSDVFGGNDDVFENTDVLEPINDITKKENIVDSDDSFFDPFNDEDEINTTDKKDIVVNNVVETTPEVIDTKEIIQEDAVDNIDGPILEDDIKTINIEDSTKDDIGDSTDMLDPLETIEEVNEVVKEDEPKEINEENIEITNIDNNVKNDTKDDIEDSADISDPLETIEEVNEIAKENEPIEKNTTEDNNNDSKNDSKENIDNTDQHIENINIDDGTIIKEEETKNEPNVTKDDTKTKEIVKDLEIVEQNKTDIDSTIKKIEERIKNSKAQTKKTETVDQNEDIKNDNLKEDDNLDSIPVNKNDDIELKKDESDKTDLQDKFDELLQKINDVYNLVNNHELIEVLGGDDDRTKTIYKISTPQDNHVNIKKDTLDKVDDQTTTNELNFSLVKGSINVSINGELLYDEISDLKESTNKSMQVIDKFNKFIFLVTEEYKKIEENNNKKEKRNILKGIFRNFMF